MTPLDVRRLMLVRDYLNLVTHGPGRADLPPGLVVTLRDAADEIGFVLDAEQAFAQDPEPPAG